MSAALKFVTADQKINLTLKLVDFFFFFPYHSFPTSPLGLLGMYIEGIRSITIYVHNLTIHIRWSQGTMDSNSNISLFHYCYISPLLTTTYRGAKGAFKQHWECHFISVLLKTMGFTLIQVLSVLERYEKCLEVSSSVKGESLSAAPSGQHSRLVMYEGTGWGRLRG